MKFSDYFNKDFHTGEEHYIKSLRTRYYRSTLDNAIEAVKKVATQNKAVIKHIDPVRGEIVFETVPYSAIVTIISTSYSEAAIDISVSTFGLLPLGKGKKVIEKIFEDIDKELPFKGISLYRG